MVHGAVLEYLWERVPNCLFFTPYLYIRVMVRTYLYILQLYSNAITILVYSNKMEYNKKAWWCIRCRVLMGKK